MNDRVSYTAFSYTQTGRVSARNFQRAHKAQAHIGKIWYQMPQQENNLWIITRLKTFGHLRADVHNVHGVLLMSVTDGKKVLEVTPQFHKLDNVMRDRVYVELAVWLWQDKSRALELNRDVMHQMLHCTRSA